MGEAKTIHGEIIQVSADYFVPHSGGPPEATVTIHNFDGTGDLRTYSTREARKLAMAALHTAEASDIHEACGCDSDRQERRGS